ncbi:hypothetical protein SERLADRAFT_390404 [Serpula lacrymans var. lacrymans S7.9]|uniref:Uncharacterized protein n=1 Tax=Serpula lacrymans var. lacrymans (strain S7.9) TaxID=578457 RepID=F8NXP7_SERL9|nr:uncharacterized protein SERLADRAFT_390404 [Serpula lacrymans var. lacrymans S7.9]EGO24719.1 hypothetical protein SERLADRAFT_390404 [Serpula lacrymans var. lacrymans S7.9]
MDVGWIARKEKVVQIGADLELSAPYARAGVQAMQLGAVVITGTRSYWCNRIHAQTMCLIGISVHEVDQ